MSDYSCANCGSLVEKCTCEIEKLTKERDSFRWKAGLMCYTLKTILSKGDLSCQCKASRKDKKMICVLHSIEKTFLMISEYDYE